MTFDPGDMPPDPFAEGAAQVVCACATDAFHLILDGGQARLRCPNCHTDQAVFPRSADIGPHRGWPQHPGLPSMAQRDMLPPPHPTASLTQPFQAGAGWGGEPPEPIRITREDLTEETAKTGRCVCPPDGRAANCRIHGPTGTAPALANFSPGMCNVYLDGGPYDGQVTFVMNGPGVEFTVNAAPGPITYTPTQRVKDGRVVYEWAG